MTPDDVLRHAGYEIRGRRAICPLCPGRRNLTVSIKGYLYYCHRCQRGGNVRALATGQGVALPALKIKKADIPKKRFADWLSRKRTEMANVEFTLTRKYLYAIEALKSFPDMDSAWQALADYYNARHRIDLFWASSRDKIGRYWLYRSWRRHNVA